jgi:asparagine synthase (glutamine-hydrolysing)
MSSFAGIVAPRADEYRGHLVRMLRALAGGVPNGRTLEQFNECLLGQVQGAAGQGAAVSGGTVAFALDGVITDLRGLRDLPPVGAPAEAVPALYQSDGAWLGGRLRGAFALVLWDDARRRLLGLRDRVGEKPLFYCWGRNGEFLFASRLKALVASGLVEPRLSRKALRHYLQRQFVPPRLTIYDNVYVLPPGHHLVVENGRLTVDCYWHPPQIRGDLTPGDAIEQLQELLHQAVERQLRGRESVAIFLDGRPGSSTLAAVARLYQSPLRTFALILDGHGRDLVDARRVARHLAADHAELRADVPDPADLLGTVFEGCDEPLAHPALLPTWLWCREAGRTHTCVLTSTGSEVLLAGGPERYLPLVWMAAAQPVSRWNLLGRRLVRGVCRLLHLRAGRWHRRVEGLSLRRRFDSILLAHDRRNQLFSHRELQRLGWPRLLKPRRPDPDRDSLDDVLRFDLQNLLPGALLARDRLAAAAHGLGLRAPFVDADLAHFCLSLPWQLKLTTRSDQRLLRRAFGMSWPEAVRRRHEQPLAAPFGRWLRRPALRQCKRRLLEDPRGPLAQLFPVDALRDIARRNNLQTWTLLTLGVWLETRPLTLNLAGPAPDEERLPDPVVLGDPA